MLAKMSLDIVLSLNLCVAIVAIINARSHESQCKACVRAHNYIPAKMSLDTAVSLNLCMALYWQCIQQHYYII